ncbi:hypothetical protein Leryth_014624 [Lithospermum erythrorhizon]|nr:hypothetical protein Leryth_014624 [Lithospermum erythrorhizon]
MAAMLKLVFFGYFVALIVASVSADDGIYSHCPCDDEGDVPFKWVLVQFIAFIVLCGLTHLLNGWTYYGPHSFN